MEHDFIHGVFHWDKGFLYSAKQLLTRPGHTTREFIEGKRVKHFNSITLLLMLAAINILVTPFTPNIISEDLVGNDGAVIANGYIPYLVKNIKLFYIVAIPVYAFFSYLLFRKAKLNYTEHIVMQTYRTCGVLILKILLRLCSLPFSATSKTAIILAGMSLPFIFFYDIWFYKQFFSKYYKNKFVTILLANAVSILPIVLFVLAAALTLSLFGSEQLLNKLIQHLPQITDH